MALYLMVAPSQLAVSVASGARNPWNNHLRKIHRSFLIAMVLAVLHGVNAMHRSRNMMDFDHFTGKKKRRSRQVSDMKCNLDMLSYADENMVP
jgi:hypothetical protein